MPYWINKWLNMAWGCLENANSIVFFFSSIHHMWINIVNWNYNWLAIWYRLVGISYNFYQLKIDEPYRIAEYNDSITYFVAPIPVANQCFSKWSSLECKNFIRKIIWHFHLKMQLLLRQKPFNLKQFRFWKFFVE